MSNIALTIIQIKVINDLTLYNTDVPFRFTAKSAGKICARVERNSKMKIRPS